MENNMKDPYVECPIFKTKTFTLRLVEQTDAKDLYECYHDKLAVKYMNDDNCDFGFYVDKLENMEETVKYWIQFYYDRAFIRFAIVDNETKKAVGTMEGFAGTDGVLRIDIKPEYEKKEYLSEIISIAQKNFLQMFGNKNLYIKAIEEDEERRAALNSEGWKFVDKYKTFDEYFEIILK